MSILGRLKINTKFNLILSSVLVALFVVAVTMTYERQQSLVIKIAIDNARVLAKQIIETRNYMSGVVQGEPEHNYNLVPQVVATQVAKRITEGSKFYVRQVSLRYRNPGNRPDDFETGMLKSFINKPVREYYSITPGKEGRTFRYMLPMVAEESCLECHGAYDKAPQFVRARFPRGHFSYNYRLGEVIGAVSVSIPMVELYHEMGVNLEFDILFRGLVIFLIISVMAVLIKRTIINPVRLVSSTIMDVTRTGSFDERLPQETEDEIGQLIKAFNDLMEEMGRKTMQSRDSEDRYRNFIEMAKSAVLTFMEDGKIVISNANAERLFGLSRQGLLGDDIFRFFDDGEELRSALSNFVRAGEGSRIREASHHTVRNFKGESIHVEMAVSISWTNHIPMLTAMLWRVDQ